MTSLATNVTVRAPGSSGITAVLDQGSATTPAIATSATRPGAPVPSTTNPLRITRSCIAPGWCRAAVPSRQRSAQLAVRSNNAARQSSIFISSI